MKRSRIQRALALILTLTFLIGGSATAVHAADASEKNPTVTDKTIKDYEAQLNTDTYSAYLAARKDKYGKPAEEILVDAAEALNPGKTDSEYEITDKYGRNGVYTPETGTTSWTFRVPESGWYSITIEYYPVEGKNTAIEREFYINGEVPFDGAYSLSFPKVYDFVYKNAAYRITDKTKTAAELLSRAEELGLTANTENRTDGTYVVFEMPEYWTEARRQFLSEELGLRFFQTDTEGNEIRPTSAQTPRWSEYSLHDSSGYSAENFMFALDEGNVTISLAGVNEALVISSFRLTPYGSYISYADYLEKYKDEKQGTSVVKLESEYASSTSSNTVYAVEDRTSAATSPADPSRTLLNTIGGEQWQNAGQFITYKFRVDNSGLYNIDARYRQNTLEGLYVCRNLYIYSDGLEEGAKGYYNGIPFAEATELRFRYDSTWQTGHLSNGTDALQFYFEAGVTYTIRLEVTLGSMSEIIRSMEAALTALDADYLTILKLTGPSPDTYRDYGFARLIPSTLIDMYNQMEVLENAAKQFRALAGTSTANIATLETIANLIRTMVSDPENEVAKNLDSLKSNLGTLGTFIGDAKTQPLQLDYLIVQGNDKALPRAEENFFRNFLHEFLSFFWSFFRDYNQMGSMVKGDQNDTIEAWVAYGRDQSQVIRNLITNDFTPVYNLPVALKLVTASTLLPSILAQAGPDVYLGLAQADVINYAVRGALIPIESMSGFDDALKNFNDAAMLTIGIEDSAGQMHYYGLPETESFYMMFVRLDILSSIGVEIPKTWDDIYAALPVLGYNNMELGMTASTLGLSQATDYKFLLYQNGGELYADGGMRINLDSPKALSAFETMCDFYTAYSCPYAYDAANRFRSGEMPIVIAPYTEMYNKLKVFATEIEGLWAMVPLPGTVDKDGNINNCSIASTTAVVMVKGVAEERKESAWNFMKWYTGADCQIAYSYGMAAVLGESGKQPTANRTALASLPWTTDEYKEVAKQYENLAAIPNYPGSYYLDRYVNFAFLSAYNSGADARSAILSYINTINTEIRRKREEFGLETLEIGQTLAEKRMGQAEDLMDELNGSAYTGLVSAAKYAIDNNNIKLLGESAAAFLAAAEKGGSDADRLKQISVYLTQAAEALSKY